MLIGYISKKEHLFYGKCMVYLLIFKYFTMMYQLQNLHNNYKRKKY